MIEHYVIIGLIVLYAVEKVAALFSTRAAARERSKLLDRILARNLSEYRAESKPTPRPTIAAPTDRTAEIEARDEEMRLEEMERARVAFDRGAAVRLE